MSIRQGNKVIAGHINYHPDLFDHKWADHLLNDVSWLRGDTFSWRDGGVYEAAYNHLADDISGKSLSSETISGVTVQFYLADDGHKICPDSQESNVASIYSATGVAWYYIIDTVNERFKLPRTKFGFTGIRSGVGNYVAESVPNIKGTFQVSSMSSATATGAFVLDSSWGSQGWDGWAGGGRTYSLDGSRSSSAYQDGAPVQQRGTEQSLYFYVGNFTQTAIENTAGLNASLFNNKADIDASNFDATGKSTIIGFAMPSGTYDNLTAGASGTTYIAPANGYVCLSAGSSTSGYVGLSNNTSGTESGSRGAWQPCFIVVKKNDTFAIYYDGSLTNFSSFRFIYAQGEA